MLLVEYVPSLLKNCFAPAMPLPVKCTPEIYVYDPKYIFYAEIARKLISLHNLKFNWINFLVK